jgi:uncharacterized protein (TIGR03382 family)
MIIMARIGALLAALLVSTLAPAARAQAVDGGVPPDCVPAFPTADGGCGIQPAVFDSNGGCSSSSGGLAAVLGFLAAAALLRRRRVGPVLLALLLLGAAVPARAQEQSEYPPYSDMTPAPRRLAITWSPLSYLVAGRIGGSASIMIVSHLGLELTLFHVDLTTGTDSNNRFVGWGQELGFRYYSGENGPRGFFIGPSLLLGNYTAIPLVGGDQIRYRVPGIAMDLGYQALLMDRFVIGLGIGAQYTRPTAGSPWKWPSDSFSLPQQELPSSIYANAGVRPRVLFALGFSFL